MGRPALTQKWDEVARLVDLGVTIRAAAAQVGVSYSRASMACKARGVMVRLPREPVARAEIVDAIKRRWTVEELSDEFGVTINTAGRWMARACAWRVPLEQVDRMRVLELASSGMSNAEIARVMSCAVSTVWHIKRKEVA